MALLCVPDTRIRKQELPGSSCFLMHVIQI